MLAQRHPDLWRGFLSELHALHCEVCDIEVLLRPVDNRVHRNGVPFRWGNGARFQDSFPGRWEEAQKLVAEYCKQATELIDHERRRPDYSQSVASLEAMLKDDEETDILLAGLQDEMEAQRDMAISATDRWQKAMDRVNRPELTREWAPTYIILLNKCAARSYVRDAASLPEPLQAHIIDEWSRKRNREAAKMGGMPRGWSRRMLEKMDSQVMLIELPTSKLFGWKWGDMYDLIVSVPIKDLKRGDFSRVSWEISN